MSQSAKEELERIAAHYGHPIKDGDPSHVWMPRLLAVLHKLEEWVPAHLRNL